MTVNTHSPLWLTPPEVARELRVSPDKILMWIRRGELVATDAASRRGGRPRYRVSREALAEFLRRREVIPRVNRPRARREPAPAKRYFA